MKKCKICGDVGKDENYPNLLAGNPVCSVCADEGHGMPIEDSDPGDPGEANSVEPKKKKKVIVINLKEFPDIHTRLQQEAKKNFRSIGMQALVIITQSMDNKGGS